MPYVVTQSCCSDASCVYACPVNCIHPTPDEPDFLTAEMMHIDPDTCVECGACVSACPVDAIAIHSELAPAQQPFLQINADFYKTNPRPRPALAQIGRAPATRRDLGPLRVAIVGSGPAAMYAADELLLQPEARVNVFEKLPTPGGLVRAGVAPDHQRTKQVTELFETIADEPGFEYFLNVEVGRDISHAELAATHHAVIYAYGASSDKKLGIEGEDLPGCASATDFVAWYNGHPAHAADRFDLAQERVVIVGNGNVALDVARILTLDPEALAATDIADHALAALRESKVREVVILARRGPSESAFTVPEFAGLIRTPGINVVLDIGEQFLTDPPYLADLDPTEAHAVRTKLELLRGLPRYGSPAADGLSRRIVLRYLTSPTRLLGTDRVTGVEVKNNELVTDGTRIGTRPIGRAKKIDAGIVLTSIGYHGEPVAGLPFDAKTGTIPNTGGRVTDVPGTYVAGWIKRGPSGFIGTNKSCSQETVNAIIDDFNAGALPTPTKPWREFEAILRRRQPEIVDRSGWHAIDRAELRRGAENGRVRVKIVDPDELVAIATGAYRQRGLRRAVEAQVNAAFVGAVKTAVKTADMAIDTVLPR